MWSQNRYSLSLSDFSVARYHFSNAHGLENDASSQLLSDSSRFRRYELEGAQPQQLWPGRIFAGTALELLDSSDVVCDTVSWSVCDDAYLLQGNAATCGVRRRLRGERCRPLFIASWQIILIYLQGRII